MNIKKKFRRSSRILASSDLPAVRDSAHIIRLVINSVSEWISAGHWKYLPTENGLPRIYPAALDFFSFGGRMTDASYEEYLVSLSASFDLQSDEIASVTELFKTAALEKLAEICENKENDGNADPIISDLSFLCEYDGENLFELLHAGEKELCTDEGYVKLDSKSKDLYRYKISRIADEEEKSETDVASLIALKARKRIGKRGHIGWYLREEKNGRLFIFITSVIPVFAVVLSAVLMKNAAAILLFLPYWSITRAICDRIAGKLVKAEYAVRVKPNGLPKTLVTTVTFISSEKDVDRYISIMKRNYLTNGRTNPSFRFGFLADLPSCEKEFGENDDKILTYAEKRIDEANSEYGNVFFAAVRKRTFDDETEKYSGHERKRGAVLDFLRMIRSENTDDFLTVYGDVYDAKYFVSLDSDTLPDIDSVEKLVSVLEAPLNAPELNTDGTAVADGYAVAVPRIDISLDSASENAFTRIVSCRGGTEIYENVSFDLYQDIFGEAVFSGKGAIDIKSFVDVLDGLVPDQTMLSHDIIEGSFLRTVFVSDAVFCDSVPKTIVSYAKRNHRWVRGDWQNLPYLKRKIRRADGKKIRNPLSFSAKFRIFDNLRRSLTPAAELLLLLAALAFNRPFFAAITLLSVFLSPVLSLIRDIFHHDGTFIRFRSCLPSGTEDIVFAFVRFLSLPYFAYTAVDAVVRSLWRMGISHKKMLEWTTAAASDNLGKGTLKDTALSMFPQLIGIFFVLRPAFLPFAVLFFSAPFVMFFLSAAKKEKACFFPSAENEMQSVWNYFSSFMTEKTNYLPPDNYQESPVRIVAERTSPTNIGLALLCTVGARDMGYIDEEKMLFLLSKTLGSLEKTEKYRGHPYNWIDTRTICPLAPRFISTVDSGNLAACLYVLKNALRENLSDESEKLAVRAEKLMNDMDFSFLYDEKKQLFFIGYDCENRRMTDSHYDFYASEARLTSYYCVAAGIVPKKHWARLNRYYIKRHGYFGIKSWNGTVFEYFMPHLFLPVKKGSLDDEMLRFAIACQYKAVPKDVPWGISESGYYSFDSELNYQYRACGVRPLAARPFPTGKNDSVVSPYSSFLASVVSPAAAEKNLGVLSEYGAVGKYGYYEAVDFPSFSSDAEPSIVMSYMAHHLGMSFLACENVLKDGIVRKRFMDEKMSAFSILLDQRLPSRVSAVKTGFRSAQERKIRYSSDERRAAALCGGGLSEIITDNGCGGLFFNGLSVTEKRNLYDENGIFALIRSGGEVLSFSSFLSDERGQFRTDFDEGSASFYAKYGKTELRQTVTVDPIHPCEIRDFAVKNGSEPIKFDIVLYFEPVLGDQRAKSAHPAFYGLSVEAEYEKNGSVLLLHRRSRGENSAEMWLAVSSSSAFEFELSRFNVLTKKGISSLPESFEKHFSCDIRGPVDPCVAVRAECAVSVRFFIACGATKQAAVSALMNVRNRELSQIIASARAESVRMNEKLCIRIEDIRVYEMFLGRLTTERSSDHGCLKSIENLWKFGISGDVPILLVRTDIRSLSKCRAFVGGAVLLAKRGIPCETVFCFYEAGSYERRITTYLRACFRAFGAENLIDKNGGVFLVNLSDISDYDFLRSCAHFTADLCSDHPIRSLILPEKTVLRDVLPLKNEYIYKTGVGGFVSENGKICFGIDDKHLFPSRPAWCHVLSDGTVGTVVSDSSPGYTFAFNAGLMKLTAWSGDALKGCSGERLTMTEDNGENAAYDILSASSCVFGGGFARYEGIAGNVGFSVEITVNSALSAKVCEITAENKGNASVEFRYGADIIMNASDAYKTVVSRRTPSAILYENPFNGKFPSACAFLAGESSLPDKSGVCASVRPGEKKTFCFLLGCAKSRNEAIKILSTCRSTVSETVVQNVGNSIKIHTPSKELDLLYNGFLYEQTLTSRIKARTGFYQCGGAYGFRDQLQDCLCLSSVEPSYLREQILLCCRRQFLEGDVFHWWHELKNENGENAPKGARTRSSDDLLWLPYAVCEYIEKTDDADILSVSVPYISGRLLDDSENEAYIEASESDGSETVSEHCVRAINKASTVGSHGLVLFGSGDWNDGMNGVKNGESVFSTLFLIRVLERFSEYCAENGFREQAAVYREAIEKNCWENDRYLRGFFDDGKPLGSESSESCKIDLLPQSFSSIVGGFDPDRVHNALSTAYERLFDRENKIVSLFSPPYTDGVSPGYISGYIRGVRENGGQYTHAAVWFALALLRAGRTDDAIKIIDAVNPVDHSKTLADVMRYRTEPYSVAADIYTNPAHPGMGGWTHYTGAAGWLFKTVTEELLGIKRVDGHLEIKPCLPSDWDGFSAEITIDGTTVFLEASRNGTELTDNGEKAGFIPLDGREHRVGFVKG